MTDHRRPTDSRTRSKAAAKAELEAEFDRRLKEGITRGRMEPVMAARGKAKVRSKAGPSY